MQGLVLSLFPGIGLLDLAFEEEGFCVVRGPDLLWGGDIRRFHPPAGRFDGVIGGPPCQAHSHLGNVVARAAGDDVKADLIPEFERCVAEAAPRWFLMENVAQAYPPRVDGYFVHRQVLCNRLDCGGEQRRVRMFCFGTPDARDLLIDWWRPPTPSALIPTVTANGTTWDKVKQRARGDKNSKMVCHTAKAQGLPEDFLDETPFTVAGKLMILGNGVPLYMGRAVAKAVKRAIEQQAEAA